MEPSFDLDINNYTSEDLLNFFKLGNTFSLEELAKKEYELATSILSVDNKKYNPKMEDKIPGINFNSKRVQIVAAFEEALRHGFKIRSSRMLNELNTFVYVNGRPDHLKGQHDDLIMACAMPIYVAENSFSLLERAESQTKSMLESWTVQEHQPTNSVRDFNPALPASNNRGERPGTFNPQPQDYAKYSWLFGR